VICSLGAKERRGEESPVRQALLSIGIESLTQLQSPATLDGGDVLFTGRHLFIGLSKRTNQEGARQLSEIFKNELPVYTLPVQEGLHLKSIMSAFDPHALLISDCPEGRKIVRILETQESLKDTYSYHFIPDAVAANVLSIGQSVIIQDGFPKSESIIRDLAQSAGKDVIKLRMSEFIKADGALTCCSILI
jgi:dimethylargininase